MKNLYIGRVEFDVVVLAENAIVAPRLIEHYAKEELSHFLLEAHQVRRVASEQDVPPHVLEEIPYGSDDDRTVRELLRPEGAQ